MIATKAFLLETVYHIYINIHSMYNNNKDCYRLNEHRGRGENSIELLRGRVVDRAFCTHFKSIVLGLTDLHKVERNFQLVTVYRSTVRR